MKRIVQREKSACCLLAGNFGTRRRTYEALAALLTGRGYGEGHARSLLQRGSRRREFDAALLSLCAPYVYQRTTLEV